MRHSTCLNQLLTVSLGITVGPPPPHGSRLEMRLLAFGQDGQVSLTGDLIYGRDQIPQYAILSHTWGADAEEVSYQDMSRGEGSNKAGYEKIRFCVQTALKDGLCHAWIDTCCIDKANFTELNRAINSMFDWYRDANKCYVYLADVSDDQQMADLSRSRWFTRGWTLQELLAPSIVEFYSRQGTFLGDKTSLGTLIVEVTGIAALALQSKPLSNFSVEERLSWVTNRQTTHPEDKVYSLLGIFGVSFPLIYGEGEARALNRLRDEIERRTSSISVLTAWRDPPLTEG